MTKGWMKLTRSPPGGDLAAPWLPLFWKMGCVKFKNWLYMVYFNSINNEDTQDRTFTINGSTCSLKLVVLDQRLEFKR